MSNMVRAISKNGGAIVCAVDSTNIVSKMESIHKTSATASAALGRLLTGAALIGSSLENKEDSVTLKLKGGGIIGTVTAICGFGGNVRGCCDCPQADLPLNPANSKLNVGALVGTGGCLTVIKDIGLNEPYIGQTPLVSGEVAEDITSYFAKSEQIPTACALGVLVNPDLTIKAAGGYMLQLLPGASEEEILLIEQNIAKLDAVTSMLNRGMTPLKIAFAVLDGFEPKILETSSAEFHCNCSRDKMRRVLISLGEQELRQLSEEQDITEIVCSYCNSKYEFTKEQLSTLIKEISK